MEITNILILFACGTIFRRLGEQVNNGDEMDAYYELVPWQKPRQHIHGTLVASTPMFKYICARVNRDRNPVWKQNSFFSRMSTYSYWYTLSCTNEHTLTIRMYVSISVDFMRIPLTRGWCSIGHHNIRSG